MMLSNLIWIFILKFQNKFSTILKNGAGLRKIPIEDPVFLNIIPSLFQENRLLKTMEEKKTKTKSVFSKMLKMELGYVLEPTGHIWIGFSKIPSWGNERNFR